MTKNKDENIKIQAWMNPLLFSDVEVSYITKKKTSNLDAGDLLKYFCVPGIPSEAKDFIERYKEINSVAERLAVVPAENNILTKLIWPLRNAVACYMAGNYLGTISLCGMAAEMVTILLFEISNIHINGKKINKKIEKNLFGSEFEKLGQDRRVKTLYASGIIKDEEKELFDFIRNKRRQYLHLYSKDHSAINEEAVRVFEKTIKAAIVVLGQELKEGKIILNPQLVEYLKLKNKAQD